MDIGTDINTEKSLQRAAQAIAHNQPRVVVVGSVNLDFIVGLEAVPERGQTVAGDSLRVLPGGKGANQATQAALLGAQVSLVGRVGSTVLAQMALAELTAAHVDITHVSRDKHLETGLAFVFVEADGDNRIVIAARANGALTASHVTAAAEVIKAADVLLLQLEVPDEAIEAAVDIAAGAGCRIVLNPAPARPLATEVLSRVNYLIPNETEAADLSEMAVGDMASTVAAARTLVGGGGLRAGAGGDELGPCGRGVGSGVEPSAGPDVMVGPDVVVVTMGEHGVIAVSAEHDRNRGDPAAVPSIHAAAVPVETVIDPTGAGDAFCAAFGVGIAAGLDLADCLALGTTAGSYAVTSTGAQAAMGNLAELTAWAADG